MGCRSKLRGRAIQPLTESRLRPTWGGSLVLIKPAFRPPGLLVPGCLCWSNGHAEEKWATVSAPPRKPQAGYYEVKLDRDWRRVQRCPLAPDSSTFRSKL